MPDPTHPHDTAGGAAIAAGPSTQIGIRIVESPDPANGFLLVLEPQDEGKGVTVESVEHIIKVTDENSPYTLRFRIDVASWQFGDPALVWYPVPQKYLNMSGDPLGSGAVFPEQNRKVARLPVDPRDVTDEARFDFFLFIPDPALEIAHRTVLVRPPAAIGHSSPFKDPTIILNPGGG